MKTKSMIALAALALLPFISCYGQAPAAANLSPAAAEVVKLAGAGTSEDVVLAYVQNSQAPFNLSADHILYLKDLGVPSPVVAAMLTRDSALHAQAPAPVVEAPPPQAAPLPMAAPAPAPEPAPPAAAPVQMAVSTPPADVAYFYNDLSPYGTWVDLPGFGWCWQPTVISTTVGWQPYCHGGHWVNTDGGWFWASDYSWGWAPFHYGRWHRHPTAGWVWFPAREWAPAWVVWRSGGEACGWAPLPLHADFVAGFGWRFNGVSVSASFDFGLTAACFSFVSLGHFCDHNLYTYRLPAAQVTTIYRNTTVINNYTYVNNTYLNHGINVALVEKATGRKLERVSIHESRAGEGAVAGLGVVRRPLGKPAPITGLHAVKMDSRGHIPANVTGVSRFTSTTTGGSSGKATGTGSQGSKFTSTGTKVTGPTHDFSSERIDSKGHSTAGSSSTSSQADVKTSSKNLHAEDLRGASGLTSHDSKTMSYTTSGSSSKNTSGNSSTGSGSSNYRNQSGSSYQHSGSSSSSSSGGSKGSTSSSSNKDPNSNSGSGNGISR
jgi:hypothetical protein